MPIAAKMVHPDRRVLATMGDGAFLMSVAEIETAVRERTAITILVWVDGGYGLIGWKQDIHFGRRAAVAFGNPDFVQLAASFGATGHAIGAADELLPTLRACLADDGVHIVRVPGRLRRERTARRAARGARAIAVTARADAPRARQIRRNTWLLVSAHGVAQIGFSMLLIIGVPAAAAITGHDWSSGIVWATAFAAAAFGAAGIGRWMDRVGRRPGLLAGYVITAAGAAGAAASIAAGSYPGLLASTVVFGAGTGAAGLARGAVADMYPPATRGRAVGDPDRRRVSWARSAARC